MIGFPFDSHVTFESDGTPVYDRAITSAPLRKLIAKLLTDGVLPNPSTNLQVEAGSGMNVVVNPGFAICAGGLKLEENQRTLAIQAADSNYDRIDTVVLRWNDNDSERICDLYIVEGIPAASPLRPELTRTESIWELGLADLFINKNSSAISNQRITDTRYETARCGIISAISEFDTTTLYQQVQADLAGFKASEQADFIAWFDDIKGQLSEDAAGNLQKQIGTLEALKTEVKTNLVNSLNWVVDKTSGVIAKLGSADISKIGDGTVTGAIVNNKEAIEDVSQSLTQIKTYVGEDGKLHFINSAGADTVIPFNSGYKEIAIVFADYQRVAACILIKPNKSVHYGWDSLRGDYMDLHASGNGNCSIIAKKAGKYLVFDTQLTTPKTSITQVDASANKTIVMSTATTQFSINVAVAL